MVSNIILLQRAIGYRLFNIEVLVQSMFVIRFKSPPIHNGVLGLDATISSNIYYINFVYN